MAVAGGTPLAATLYDQAIIIDLNSTKIFGISELSESDNIRLWTWDSSARAPSRAERTNVSAQEASHRSQSSHNNAFEMQIQLDKDELEDSTTTYEENSDLGRVETGRVREGDRPAPEEPQCVERTDQ